MAITGRDRIVDKYQERGALKREPDLRKMRDNAERYAQTGKMPEGKPRDRQEVVEREVTRSLGDRMRKNR